MGRLCDYKLVLNISGRHCVFFSFLFLVHNHREFNITLITPHTLIQVYPPSHPLCSSVQLLHSCGTTHFCLHTLISLTMNFQETLEDETLSQYPTPSAFILKCNYLEPKMTFLAC